MITISGLPTDANGIVQGAWRLVHIDPNYNGPMGIVTMRHGVAIEPIAGRPLRLVVAEHGPKLFIEPWGAELPPHYHLPELVKPSVTDDQLAKLERAPWRDVLAEAVMPLTLELIKLGGDGAPADFAKTVEEIPTLLVEEARDARTFFTHRAATLREDGYVEIPKALDGFVEQLTAIIDADEAAKAAKKAAAPPEAPPDAPASQETAPLAPALDTKPISTEPVDAPAAATKSSESLTSADPPKAPVDDAAAKKAAAKAKKDEAAKAAKKEPPAPT